MVTKSQDELALQELLDNNRNWAESVLARDKDFFNRLASQQSPQYMWIGCSDSRVPANELLGLMPGEIFVHRNVANLVVHTDLNCLSVLQFAIDVLKVKHIIVCGHYGCSGVHAAMTRRRVGLADNWLRHVQDVHQKHEAYLGEVLSEHERHTLLCELNVIEQVSNVCQTTSVQDAWERNQPLTIHSWVYGLKDGRLRDLGFTVSGTEGLTAQMEQCVRRYREGGGASQA